MARTLFSVFCCSVFAALNSSSFHSATKSLLLSELKGVRQGHTSSRDVLGLLVSCHFKAGVELMEFERLHFGHSRLQEHSELQGFHGSVAPAWDLHEALIQG